MSTINLEVDLVYMLESTAALLKEAKTIKEAERKLEKNEEYRKGLSRQLYRVEERLSEQNDLIKQAKEILANHGFENSHSDMIEELEKLFGMRKEDSESETEV
jgi:hypothetical protein